MRTKNRVRRNLGAGATLVVVRYGPRRLHQVVAVAVVIIVVDDDDDDDEHGWRNLLSRYGSCPNTFYRAAWNADAV